MPYTKTTELPAGVKNNLPEHAQHIYLKAFNNAWNEYAQPSKRREKDESHEEVAHRVAWTAVKQEYEKVGGRWMEKD
jgi:cation transport regulator